MVTDARHGRDEIACAWHNFASSLYIASKCWPRVSDTKHFPRKGCRHMRIQNWGWTHIQLTGKENVSMYYCTILYCTTILLHTLFTLVLYLSMYTRTHPKHTRGTNPFSAISPCITFLVIVVVVGLVTNSLYDRVHASGVMPIPFSRLLPPRSVR